MVEIALQKMIPRSRLPPGRRGLKSAGIVRIHHKRQSPPTREAWIEIDLAREAAISQFVASHPGGVD